MQDATIIAGRFVLGKELGRGSFGEIHLGKQIENNIEVAIKLV